AAFASGADLRNAVKTSQVVFEMDEDAGVIVGGDGDFVVRAFAGFGKGFDAAARFAANGNDRGEIRANLRDALAGDEHGEVHPVCADVGNGAKVAAEVGFEAPVPVRGKEEPILMKLPVDERGAADGSGGDESPRLLAERIVAKVVRDAADFSGFFLDGAQHGGFARIHGERLFAEYVFAGAKKRAGLFEVNVIRRTDVNAGDFFVGGEFGEGRVGAFEAEGFCGR